MILNELPINIVSSWTSVSPNSAPVLGGSFITVSGSGFVATVSFRCRFLALGVSPVLSAPVYPASSSIIVCVSPRWTSSTLLATIELVQGVADQKVLFNSGSSSTFHFAFENWLSLSPISGPVTGGSSLTVSGAGFATDGSSHYSCSFQFKNGLVVTSSVASVVSSGLLTCILPSLKNQPHDSALFSVRNLITDSLIGKVGSNTLFTFVPIILSFSPNVSSIAVASVISISGDGFDVNNSYSCIFKQISGLLVGSTNVVVSSAVAVSCPSLLTALVHPTDVLLALTDGLTEVSVGIVTLMPALISIHPSVICFDPSATITVYGTGFDASEQYSLLLNFQPVDDNFLKTVFPGTYYLPRKSVSIKSSTSSAAHLIFELPSSVLDSGAVDIIVSLKSDKDPRTFLNSLNLFPSLYGRPLCASVSVDTGSSISAVGKSLVTVSVSNGVFPKLSGSPSDWILRGTGFQSFNCIFASRDFSANSSASVVSADASNSNFVGTVKFTCIAPAWLSSATNVRIYIRFHTLFLPVPFFVGSKDHFSIVEVISSVFPSMVPFNSVRLLTVSGYGFMSNNSAYFCVFSNIQSNVSVLSSTALTCRSPVLSIPAALGFTVTYANGAPISVVAGNSATTVIFSASILHVSPVETPISNAQIVLFILGLNTINARHYECRVAFVSSPAFYELSLHPDGLMGTTNGVSVACNTTKLLTYASLGQINGGSATVTLNRLNDSASFINGSVALSFFGDITSIFPSSSSVSSQLITVRGTGFIPGFETAQVCSFQSVNDSSLPPITSASVGLSYNSMLVCEKPILPFGEYSLSIRFSSQLIARSISEVKFIASSSWTSIVPDKFSASGGTVFSVVGSSFSIRSTYIVKFYADEIVHFVSVVASPVSATLLSGYSPAWPFPASQVNVSVEFQGAPISSHRKVVSYLPEISELQTLSDFSGPFVYVKGSGLSPVEYRCTISDIRTGLSVHTMGALINSNSKLPKVMRPIQLISGFDQPPHVVNAFTLLFPFVLLSQPSQYHSPPFYPDFSWSLQDWSPSILEFNLSASVLPVVFERIVEQDILFSAFSVSSWSQAINFPASAPPLSMTSFLRLSVRLASPQSSHPSDIVDGIMVQCVFEIEFLGNSFNSSYSVLLFPHSQVQCSHSFLDSISRVTIHVNSQCLSCKFSVVDAIVEKRKTLGLDQLLPSTFIYGSRDFGCKGTSSHVVAFVFPLESIGTNTLRESIAICVINNTHTVPGAATALFAKISVSSVNPQYNANATVSYRVLYHVSSESFFPDLHWLESSSSSSFSTNLQKLWSLSEPVTAALPYDLKKNGATFSGAGFSDTSVVFPSLCASNLRLESDRVSKLDFTTVSCDASSITEGQKLLVVAPLSPSHFRFQSPSLSFRLLPKLSVLSFRIPASGNSRFLFKITGLDLNYSYQLLCTFRSSVSMKIYSSSVESVVGSHSLFACVSPVADARGTSWTFSVSSAQANFTLVEPLPVTVSDQLRLNVTDIDSSAGRFFPFSTAYPVQEPLRCTLSGPVTESPQSVELIGGAFATIPAPSFLNIHQFSISLWLKPFPAARDNVWINIVSALNSFRISIVYFGELSSSGASAKIQFCVYVTASKEACVNSTTVSIMNVWTHIFAGVNDAFGDLVLVINGEYPDAPFKEPLFDLRINPSLIFLGHNSSSDANSIPFNGLIDNVRIFSELLSSNLVSELRQRTFSTYPPVNLMMSLTFDDGEGIDEISGNSISSHMLPFSTMKGQWFSQCIQLASGITFSYSAMYNDTHVYEQYDSVASSWMR
jgi:hypothetical protein